MRFIVLVGPEGYEKEPHFFTDEGEMETFIADSEDRGEFCVAYKLTEPYYSSTD